MKHKNHPSITDLAKIINEKKNYLFLFFFVGVLLSVYISTKSYSKYTMSFELVEKYYPISDPIKSEIRSKILRSTNDKNYLAQLSPNKKLKEKLLDGSILVSAELNSKSKTGSPQYFFKIKVFGNKLAKADHSFFSDSIIKLLKILETKTRKELADTLNVTQEYQLNVLENSENFVEAEILDELSQMFISSNENKFEIKLKSEIGDLIIGLEDTNDQKKLSKLLEYFYSNNVNNENSEINHNTTPIDIELLIAEKINFFERQPQQVEFQQDKVKTETLITIPLLFLLFGMFIFTLKRFF